MPHLVDIKEKPQAGIRIKLSQILEQVGDYGSRLKWSLLYFSGTGNLGKGRTITGFEAEINRAPYGLVMTWEELLELSAKFWDVYHIVLVGCHGEPRVKEEEDFLAWYAKSQMVVELFDSWFWRIYSDDERVIDRLMQTFNHVEIRDSLLTQSSD